MSGLKKLALGLCLFFVCLAPSAFALADTANSGIAPGNIWYSEDPFQEGDQVQIYTVLFNSDSRQMAGTVEFYDDVLLLGKKNFSLAPEEAASISIGWEVGLGTHKIFAKLTGVRFKNPDGTYESATLTNSTTATSIRTVEHKPLPAAATQNDANVPSIAHIQNLINKNAPSFLAQPFVRATQAVENFRQNAAKTAQQKFPYIAFIFSNWIVFYILFFLLIFLFIRFIWRLIF